MLTALALFAACTVGLFAGGYVGDLVDAGLDWWAEL